LTRRGWLLAGLGISVSARPSWGREVPSLVLEMDGEILYVAAPDLHFVSGKPLERLKDGDAVTYVAQLSLSLDGNRTIFRRQPQRFVFSYDIWEGKFSVTSGTSPHKVFPMAEKAEAWCLESLAISTSGIPQDMLVWARLDVRVGDAKDPAGLTGEGPFSLRNLIEVFSRPARAEQPHWMRERPPFRLSDLKKAGRGSRSG